MEWIKIVEQQDVCHTSMLHKYLNYKVKKWEAISERILWVELKNKDHIMIIIAVYGPNENAKLKLRTLFGKI